MLFNDIKFLQTNDYKNVAEALFKLALQKPPQILSLILYSHFLYNQKRYVESLNSITLIENYLTLRDNNPLWESSIVLTEIDYPLFEENIGVFLNYKNEVLLYLDIYVHYLSLLNLFRLKNIIDYQILNQFAFTVAQHVDYVSYYFLASYCQLVNLKIQANATEAIALLHYSIFCIINNKIDIAKTYLKEFLKLLSLEAYFNEYIALLENNEKNQSILKAMSNNLFLKIFLIEKLKSEPLPHTNIKYSEINHKNTETLLSKQLENISLNSSILQTPDKKLIKSCNLLSLYGLFANPLIFQNEGEKSFIEIQNRYNLSNVSQRSLGNAFLRAVIKNKLNDIQFLINHIEDINVQEENPESKRTALHYAVINNYVECCKLLLLHQARTDIKDAFGLTSKEYAEQAGNAEILLQQTSYIYR